MSKSSQASYEAQEEASNIALAELELLTCVKCQQSFTPNYKGEQQNMWTVCEDCGEEEVEEAMQNRSLDSNDPEEDSYTPKDEDSW